VRLVAPAVAQLLHLSAVIGEAVRLNDEAEVGPVEVDTAGTEVLLGSRQPDAVLPQDGEEAALEVGVRAAVAGKRFSHHTNTREQRHFVERAFERLRIDEVQTIGFVDRCFE
jgi:hypothetical protein